ERHRQQAARPLEGPSAFLGELLPLLPTGPALDLACGTGRNTLFLSERQPVTAVDRSRAALEILEERALASRRQVSRGTVPAPAARGIRLVCCDLEGVRLPSQAFELIVCFRYLERRLFPDFVRALVPGGALLFETYTKAQLAFAKGPKNPHYLLESG